MNAKLAQLRKRRQRRLVVADQHGFGNLQLEPARIKPGIGERGGDVQRQSLRLELHRRNVDGNANVRRPARSLAAGGVEHPLADFLDQAGLLGDRDELRRRDHAAARMPPAQERLAANDFLAADIDERLIMDRETAFDHGGAHVVFELAAGIGFGLHPHLEEAVDATARGLGGIHRKIRALEQAEQIEPSRGATATPIEASALSRWPWHSNGERNAGTRG